MNTRPPYDIGIVGSGPSGMMAAIHAKQTAPKLSVAIFEHKPRPGMKLLATGGGRCNLTNTLPQDVFVEKFGKAGKFMTDALHHLSSEDLQHLLLQMGIETHAPDGFRVWPVSHQAKTVLQGLKRELQNRNVHLRLNNGVKDIQLGPAHFFLLSLSDAEITCRSLIIATGGLSWPSLGATGDGYQFAKALGHKLVQPVPAGVPLVCKESWPGALTAHTIGNAELHIDDKKYRKQIGRGDIIFTNRGIAGPMVLDISGEISHILHKKKEVPIHLKLHRFNKEQWQQELQRLKQKAPGSRLIADLLAHIFPSPVTQTLLKITELPPDATIGSLTGIARDRFCNMLWKTPLSIIGTEGFDSAFVTRGGVSLKDIAPNTLGSKHHKGLYFCGEVVDLDGPCGGFNLQWAFSSGALAGSAAAQALLSHSGQ